MWILYKHVCCIKPSFTAYDVCFFTQSQPGGCRGGVYSHPKDSEKCPSLQSTGRGQCRECGWVTDPANQHKTSAEESKWYGDCKGEKKHILCICMYLISNNVSNCNDRTYMCTCTSTFTVCFICRKTLDTTA